MYINSYGNYIIIVTLTKNMWMMFDCLRLPPYDGLLTFSSKSFISSTKAFHKSLESGYRNLWGQVRPTQFFQMKRGYIKKITSLWLRLCAKLHCHVETGNACFKTLGWRNTAVKRGCKVKMYPNENYKLKPQKTAAGKSDMGVSA